MNELELDGKTYVSSKRAAEMTGYAKDYIGQMCREGRVEARLVGRNWYILKSGLEKHRFGSDQAAPEPEKAIHGSSRDTEWQSPRYEIESGSDFPLINRLQSPPEEPVAATEEPVISTLEAMQAAWRGWFNAEGIESAPEPLEEPESTDTPISIHSIAEESPRQEGLNLRRIREYQINERNESGGDGVRITERPLRVPQGRSYLVLRASLVLCAVLAVLVGYIGSGLAGASLISYSPFSIVSGVSLYNKAK
jgi:hypothetical protein